MTYTTYPQHHHRDVKLQAISPLAYISKQNTTPQKPPHKDIAQNSVEVIHNNPLMKNASLRVKIPINLPNPAPAPRKNPKLHTPTAIVAYVEYK